MKSNALKLATLSLIPAALLAFTSCSSMPADEEIGVVETPDGAAIVDVTTITATVSAIDATTRKVTLTDANGKRHTFKAGPEVVNFNQIQIGDKVRATLTEEFAIVIGKPGTPTSAGGAAAVVLAPKGAKPGVFMADAQEVTAKITAIDSKHRKVTFEFVDGSTKTLKVGKKADLSKVMPGDTVTVQVATSLGIFVEKP